VLVYAVIALCLRAEPAKCQSQTIRVDERACSALEAFKKFPAGAVPLDGEWASVTIRAGCSKSKVRVKANRRGG